MKYADVQPAFQKDDKTDKENYRPISTLPNLSKVYETLMYDQMYPFFEQIFSKLQCSFRKDFSTEQCLIHLIEKWRKYFDTGSHGSGLLTDISEAFDCIDHQLLIAKLNAYGVDTNLLYFLASDLEKRKRKQRTKVNGSCSKFDDIFSGALQGSILGPLLFNIYIYDLIFGIGGLDIANYTDDNTPYIFSSELDMALKKLRSYTIKIFKWFHDNRVKSNPGKCTLITNSTSLVEIKIENTIISSVKRVKLLGVHIDGRLDFDYHVNQICKKASKKIHALSRVCKYMDQNKRRMLMKAFIISQFSYCPLVWMFHSRNTKNRVNKIHERALRLVYDDSPYVSLDEVLIKDKSVNIHQRNLQFLGTEIFKVKNGLSTELTEDIFHFVNKPYDLRNNRILLRKRNRTDFYGTECLSSLAPRIWELVPQSLKNEAELSQFKIKIKT